MCKKEYKRDLGSPIELNVTYSVSDGKRCSWVQHGYLLFSQGQVNLNVERLARELGVSKSSFYHYFHTVENFEEHLLALHLEQGKAFGQDLLNLANPLPDILHLFLERKEDMFFHKYLRVNRGVDRYKNCYEESFASVEGPMLEQWKTLLGLNSRPLFAKSYLHLLSDNFFLRITRETYSLEWLQAYLEEALYFLGQGLKE